MDHLTKVKKNVFQPLFPNIDVFLHNVQKYSEEKDWREWTVEWVTFMIVFVFLELDTLSPHSLAL